MVFLNKYMNGTILLCICIVLGSQLEIPLTIIEKNTNQVLEYIKEDVKQKRELNFHLLGTREPWNEKQFDETKTEYEILFHEGIPVSYAGPKLNFEQLKERFHSFFGEDVTYIGLEKKFIEEKEIEENIPLETQIPCFYINGVLKTSNEVLYLLHILIMVESNLCFVDIDKKIENLSFLQINPNHLKILFLNEINYGYTNDSCFSIQKLTEDKTTYLLDDKHPNEEITPSKALTYAKLFQLVQQGKISISENDFQESTQIMFCNIL